MTLWEYVSNPGGPFNKEIDDFLLILLSNGEPYNFEIRMIETYFKK